jgi:hypothetical protein
VGEKKYVLNIQHIVSNCLWKEEVVITIILLTYAMISITTSPMRLLHQLCSYVYQQGQRVHVEIQSLP